MRRIDTLSAGIGPPARHSWRAERRAPAQWSSACHPSRGGRLQIGMAVIKSVSVAGFIPESVADFPRKYALSPET
jgi:hypothetical protein